MIRVTRAKRATRSTVDSPAPDAADNNVDGSKTPAEVKSKKKPRKEEVEVDSDMEEEIEDKKSKKRGRKKGSSSSSSKRKSKSSKAYESSEESAEDIPSETRKSKSERQTNKKQDKEESSEREVAEIPVQQEKSFNKKEKKDHDRKSQEKHVQDEISEEKKVEIDTEQNNLNIQIEANSDITKNEKDDKPDKEHEVTDESVTTMKSIPKPNSQKEDSEQVNQVKRISVELPTDTKSAEKAKDNSQSENDSVKQDGKIEVADTQENQAENVTQFDRESQITEDSKQESTTNKESLKPKSPNQTVNEEQEIKKHKDIKEVIEKKEDKKESQEKTKHESQETTTVHEKQNECSPTKNKLHDDKINNCNDTLNKSDVASSQEDSTENAPSTPFVINRKRKWGSRPTKITTQKSLTISTDVLKDIIPDVKPVAFDEVIEQKKHEEKRRDTEKIHKPILPKIVIDNTVHKESIKREEGEINNESSHPLFNRKVSIVKENDITMKPLSPPRNKSSNILYITNLVRPFTLPQLKNLLQRTGRIVEDGFWIDKIKSKCYVKYETEDQAIETRHALHGVTWPISNPKSLQVDFSSEELFEKAKVSEENPAPTAKVPGTVEDWLREQDLKRAQDELEKPWQRKMAVREWDVGKGEKDKEHPRREEKPERRRHRTPERHSPEPAKKFKKKEEEAPAKLLDELFRKTKTTPCIYWLPLSSETIAVKEEQRRVHMLEHERRMQEIRRQRRH